MNKPRLFDLFCGDGGAAMGYHQAGFEVTGIDIESQPNYPFEFYQGDALTVSLDGFDAYHASPPCTKWSLVTKVHGGQHDDLLTPIRERLIATKKPYIIENVRGAPLRNPFMLCGTMFGLKVRRHRYFECSFDVYFAPATCACKGKAGFTNAQRGRSSFKNKAKLITITGHNFSVTDARVAMNIDWMKQKGLSQAIPPAYTEYIGRHLMAVVLEIKENGH